LNNLPRKDIAGENAVFAFSNESSRLQLQPTMLLNQQFKLTQLFI
jgi:hypothetical protein